MRHPLPRAAQELRTYRLTELDVLLDLDRNVLRWLDRLANIAELDCLARRIELELRARPLSPRSLVASIWMHEIWVIAERFSAPGETRPHPALIAALAIRHATGRAPDAAILRGLVEDLSDPKVADRAALLSRPCVDIEGAVWVPFALTEWVQTGRVGVVAR